MQIDMTSIFTQLGVLFFIMVIGYVLKYSKHIDATFDRALSKVVLEASLPCLVIGSVLNADVIPPTSQILTIFGMSFAAYALLIAMGEIACRVLMLPNGRRGVYKFMTVFGNVCFVGFPVISSIFGEQALIYAAMFNIPFNLLVFTLGVVWLMSDRTEETKVIDGITVVVDRPKFQLSWKLFATPANIACAVVVVLCLLGVNHVPVVTQCCVTLGSLTTPAALLVIGSNLANLPIRELLGGPRLYLQSVIRLVVAPLAVWGVFHFFVSDPMLLGIMVVVSGMPVASNGTLLCFQYGGDMQTMSRCTFITTLLSFVTIPLLVMFLTTMG